MLWTWSKYRDDAPQIVERVYVERRRCRVAVPPRRRGVVMAGASAWASCSLLYAPRAPAPGAGDALLPRRVAEVDEGFEWRSPRSFDSRPKVTSSYGAGRMGR